MVERPTDQDLDNLYGDLMAAVLPFELNPRARGLLPVGFLVVHTDHINRTWQLKLLAVGVAKALNTVPSNVSLN